MGLLLVLICGALVSVTFVMCVPRPTCQKYPSCSWNIPTDTTLCSGIDEENECPGGRLSCFNGTEELRSCCCVTPNPALRHLEKGDENPPRDGSKLRLYLIRFCPYCHRVALISYAKGITTDIVYVNLRNNPVWFTNESKLGRLVPMVETDLGNINGSLIVADFLDETYPMPGDMYPCNKILKAMDRIFIDNFNKVMPPLLSSLATGKAYKDPSEASAIIQQFEENLAGLGHELRRRGSTYFAGNEKPGMVDYMIWPWIERKPLIQMIHPTAADYTNTDTTIATWTELMRKDKAVQHYGLAPEAHYEFVQSVQKTEDRNPSYNLLV